MDGKGGERGGSVYNIEEEPVSCILHRDTPTSLSSGQTPRTWSPAVNTPVESVKEKT